jgi:nitrogen fixation NifU-like protein
MFSKILLGHFQRPRNAGELAEATACVEVSNPVCGDVLRLAVNVEAGRIREVKFLCRGCTTAIACASMLTEKMQGAEVVSLRGIAAKDLAESLGGLPEASFHGAQLAEDGVKALLAAVGKVNSQFRSE